MASRTVGALCLCMIVLVVAGSLRACVFATRNNAPVGGEALARRGAQKCNSRFVAVFIPGTFEPVLVEQKSALVDRVVCCAEF